MTARDRDELLTDDARRRAYADSVTTAQQAALEDNCTGFLAAMLAHDAGLRAVERLIRGWMTAEPAPAEAERMTEQEIEDVYDDAFSGGRTAEIRLYRGSHSDRWRVAVRAVESEAWRRAEAKHAHQLADVIERSAHDAQERIAALEADRDALQRKLGVAREALRRCCAAIKDLEGVEIPFSEARELSAARSSARSAIRTIDEEPK
jgi:hypothetical protein